MMLFGPGVKNITVANNTKAIRSDCDMGALRMGTQVILGKACGRLDSSMTAMPPTAVTVISSGENSSSAIRLATKPSPQITTTRTARPTSKGFIAAALALLAGLRFPQQIG